MRITRIVSYLFSVSISLQYAAWVVAADHEIPAIIIEADKEQHKLSSERELTRDQLQAEGAQNLKQALSSAGNVQLIESNGESGRFAVSMRGFGETAAQNSLIVVDGIPSVNADLGIPLLYDIDVDHIEILRVDMGSRGVEYGDQAVGGVVTIDTRPSDYPYYRGGLTAGSFNTASEQLAFGNSINETFSYDVQAKQYFSDNYRQHNSSHIATAGAAIGYVSDASQLELRFNYLDYMQQLAGALTAEQMHDNPRQATNSTDFSHDKHTVWLLRQQHDFSNGWYGDFKIRYRDIAINSVLSNTSLLQQRNVTQLIPELHRSISMKNGDFNLTVGNQIEYDEYSATGFNTAITHQLASSAYIYADYPLLQSVNLRVGARYAEMDGLQRISGSAAQAIAGSAWVTDFGMTYDINKAASLFIRRSGSYRFPKADENSWLAPGVRELKPQTGNSYELGVDISCQATQARWSVYWLGLKNEIAFVPEEQASIGYNRNLAHTDRSGTTLWLEHAVSEKLSASLAYSYVNAKQTSGAYRHKRIPLVAIQQASASLKYQWRPNWSIYLEDLYTGARYPAGDDQNQSGLLGGFTIMNTSLYYSNQPWMISLRLNNVMNKHYATFASFSAAKPPGETVSYYPAAGRNFMIQVGVEV